MQSVKRCVHMCWWYACAFKSLSVTLKSCKWRGSVGHMSTAVPILQIEHCNSKVPLKGESASSAQHSMYYSLQMINKLLYRSRQRGFLELDLLVGLWAEREVPKMDTAMLQHFATVLDQVRVGESTRADLARNPVINRQHTRSPLLHCANSTQVCCQGTRVHICTI